MAILDTPVTATITRIAQDRNGEPILWVYVRYTLELPTPITLQDDVLFPYTLDKDRTEDRKLLQDRIIARGKELRKAYAFIKQQENRLVGQTTTIP